MVVEKYYLPVPGAAGLVFGGREKNQLFVIIESTIIDAISGGIVQNRTDGSSIYVLSDIGAKGLPSVRLNILH